MVRFFGRQHTSATKDVYMFIGNPKRKPDKNRADELFSLNLAPNLKIKEPLTFFDNEKYHDKIFEPNKHALARMRRIIYDDLAKLISKSIFQNSLTMIDLQYKLADIATSCKMLMLSHQELNAEDRKDAFILLERLVADASQISLALSEESEGTKQES